ncbi:hypothetical protein MUN82_07265 [Hymenobacter aerilatus]|uniref:Uncharacterized protein n=1 Tax=Hymenobacter aerilatus TaxID=2932251 RepID=A0A8T9SXD8_9BACT|nr:hypothetical protein [Hymenobacter aerilatus]UOR06892.1 hypothetical protein MUN82_07265 [Hymenobacter aerilatus]
MPKTIDYPRTTYASAWEVAEVVDDTGGKCAIETSAKKLDRKVSGSYKAIIGSAVKFGLLTSKREILTTTNLYRRIKHAYDKQEEKIYHREAFLHPPLFMQICRKFRNRELPVHMFDVMLIREFGVEEINAQNVAKAFVEGARMVDILDERNVIADVDQLANQQTPRRQLASTEMPTNLFAASSAGKTSTPEPESVATPTSYTNGISPTPSLVPPLPPLRGSDAVSALFGLDTADLDIDDDSATEPDEPLAETPKQLAAQPTRVPATPTPPAAVATTLPPMSGPPTQQPTTHHSNGLSYSIQISGPGIETHLLLQDAQDLAIVSILLEKIRKQLTA